MENNISLISNFKHNDKIRGFYLCKVFQNKITRLGDEYLDLVLEDSTGSIRAKVWSYVDQYKSKIKEGIHVAVKGKVITYNDNLEIDILYINSIENGLYDKYGYTEDLILKYSKKEINKLFNKLLSYCNSISTPHKKEILKTINDHKFKIIRIPSIYERYDFTGGFIVQLISILNLNSKVHKLYSYDYPRSVVGIIFKNIGLLDYFDVNNNCSISEKNKNSGFKLLGIKFTEKCFKTEDDTVSFIKNLIISDEKSQSNSINIINSLYDFDYQMNNFLNMHLLLK